MCIENKNSVHIYGWDIIIGHQCTHEINEFCFCNLALLIHVFLDIKYRSSSIKHNTKQQLDIQNVLAYTILSN